MLPLTYVNKEELQKRNVRALYASAIWFGVKNCGNHLSCFLRVYQVLQECLARLDNLDYLDLQVQQDPPVNLERL